MFENITAAPADPILGLADLFRADERPGKINLGIGVYKDETGKTPVLTSVKKAEQYLLENETTKNYLGIDGIPEFGRCTQELLFGKGSALINDKRARTAQTPGGTGALRVAADFLAKNTSVKRVGEQPAGRTIRASLTLQVWKFVNTLIMMRKITLLTSMH